MNIEVTVNKERRRRNSDKRRLWLCPNVAAVVVQRFSEMCFNMTWCHFAYRSDFDLVKQSLTVVPHTTSCLQTALLKERRSNEGGGVRSYMLHNITRTYIPHDFNFMIVCTILLNQLINVTSAVNPTLKSQRSSLPVFVLSWQLASIS